MKNIIRIEKLLIIVVCLLLTTSALPQGRRINSLDSRISKYKVKNVTIIGALEALANDDVIPIGFEKISTTSQSKEVEFSLSLNDRTARQILDELVRKDNRYTWSFEHDVVRVRPKVELRDCLSQIAETRVQEFYLDSRISYLSLRANLTNIPEVKKMISMCNLRPSHIDTFLFDVRYVPIFKIECRESTFSSILDDIVKQGNRRLWLLNSIKGNENELILNFL